MECGNPSLDEFCSGDAIFLKNLILNKRVKNPASPEYSPVIACMAGAPKVFGVPAIQPQACDRRGILIQRIPLIQSVLNRSRATSSVNELPRAKRPASISMANTRTDMA